MEFLHLDAFAISKFFYYIDYLKAKNRKQKKTPFTFGLFLVSFEKMEFLVFAQVTAIKDAQVVSDGTAVRKGF